MPKPSVGAAGSKAAPGMIQQGNIDLNHRPVITNADGSHSTIFSVTVPTGDGKFALVPSIVDGKFLTPDGKMPNRSLHDSLCRRSKMHHTSTTRTRVSILAYLSPKKQQILLLSIPMPTCLMFTTRKVLLAAPGNRDAVYIRFD